MTSLSKEKYNNEFVLYMIGFEIDFVFIYLYIYKNESTDIINIKWMIFLIGLIFITVIIAEFFEKYDQFWKRVRLAYQRKKSNASN